IGYSSWQNLLNHSENLGLSKKLSSGTCHLSEILIRDRQFLPDRLRTPSNGVPGHNVWENTNERDATRIINPRVVSLGHSYADYERHVILRTRNASRAVAHGYHSPSGPDFTTLFTPSPTVLAASRVPRPLAVATSISKTFSVCKIISVAVARSLKKTPCF